MAPSACQTVAACPPIRSSGSSVRGSLPPTPQSVPLASGVKQEADPARLPRGSTGFLGNTNGETARMAGANGAHEVGIQRVAGPAGHAQRGS